MDTYEQLKRLEDKINDADAIVIGVASGMSAASGFRFYYMDDPTYRMIAGGLADKYDIHSMFDLLYDPRLSRGEWWAMILRTIKYIYECETGETYTDLAELVKDKNYYAVTTNQDAQLFRVFPADKITRLQGDWRYFQTKDKSVDEIFYNHDMVMDLIPKIEGDVLPEEYFPRYKKTGVELVPWIRSREFLEGKFYMEEFERYMRFLRQNLDKKTLFLELGVGMMTPMFIKEPFMNMVYQWKDATYATINPKHAIIPKEIAAKSIAIDRDINCALRTMLGKPTDHIKDADSKDVFNPARPY